MPFLLRQSQLLDQPGVAVCDDFLTFHIVTGIVSHFFFDTRCDRVKKNIAIRLRDKWIIVRELAEHAAINLANEIGQFENGVLPDVLDLRFGLLREKSPIAKARSNSNKNIGLCSLVNTCSNSPVHAREIVPHETNVCLIYIFIGH